MNKKKKKRKHELKKKSQNVSTLYNTNELSVLQKNQKTATLISQCLWQGCELSSPWEKCETNNLY